ncbi:MAG: hypothetical protein M1825_001501 [Sarcosagium campestre]|nr:MAG: hypothetical protein M1825_001501 [Sarcosagium campestre]
MLDGLFTLLILSAVMAIAYVNKIAPARPIAQANAKMLQKGVETLYSASSVSQAHQHLHSRAPSPPAAYVKSAQGYPYIQTRSETEKEALDEEKSTPVDSEVLPGQNSNAAEPQETVDDVAQPGSSTSERSPHAYVGLSLILGFILMYLVDQIPQHVSAASQTQSQPYHISLDNLSQGLHRPSSQDEDIRVDGQTDPRPAARQSRSRATTTGLVIHAAADGIALGASSTTNDSSLGFIIFLAIMIHKAPAAFGLTSVLLKQGLTKRETRAHLLIFSLAAPAGAIATWAFVNILGQGHTTGDDGTRWWTGVILLFSAGTFL